MKLLSLFSGCGGMDIGFEGGFTCLKKSINLKKNPHWIEEDLNDFIKLVPTGFKTIFANDINKDAKTAWLGYFGKENENIYHLQSIVDLIKDCKENGKILAKDVDIITGGFPCQDFSRAGKQLGFNSQKSHDGKNISSACTENRGQLYMWMKETIELVKPKIFIAENVKGMIDLKGVKEIIQSDFSKSKDDGYLVLDARILNASDFGVPQNRERIFFIGFRKNALNKKALKELSKAQISAEFDPYPSPTHGKNLLPKVSSLDAFIHLKEPEFSDDLSQQKYSKAKFMGKHCQGQNEINLLNPSPTIRAEHHGNIEFRRLSAQNGGKNLAELKNGLKERRLSVRECARLQTFPDDYEFVIPGKLSASAAYKIIGNAVPCVLAYNIAMNLAQKWEIYFNDSSKR